MQLLNEINLNNQLAANNSEAISDSIKFRGRVMVTYEDEDGSTGLLHYKDNIIVNVARDTVCHLLTSPQTNRHITTFKIGTRGHNNDILTPVAPTVNDTGLLDGSSFSKAVNGFTLMPSSGLKNQIDFSISLEKTEANNSGSSGKAYTEAGLYTADGRLFARETFPAIIKTPNRRINFIWSILL